MVFTISNFQTGFPIFFPRVVADVAKGSCVIRQNPKTRACSQAEQRAMTGLTGGDNCQNVAFVETPVQNMKASSVAIELISIENCKAETNAIRSVKLRIEEYHNVPMSRDVIESQKVMETHQL